MPSGRNNIHILTLPRQSTRVETQCTPTAVATSAAVPAKYSGWRENPLFLNLLIPLILRLIYIHKDMHTEPPWMRHWWGAYSGGQGATYILLFGFWALMDITHHSSFEERRSRLRIYYYSDQHGRSTWRCFKDYGTHTISWNNPKRVRPSSVNITENRPWQRAIERQAPAASKKLQ